MSTIHFFGTLFETSMLVLEVCHKKLRYLNNSEKPWDMENPINTAVFSTGK